jgi:hypothetical protein
VCKSTDLRTSQSFGEQPPSNRFFNAATGADEVAERHHLSLGYCGNCETMQLVNRMPVEAIRPRYDWLVYNEPEGHLDNVAETLANLAIDKKSRFVGVTYKDQSTLDRLNRHGFSNTACVNESDLNCDLRPFGLETIQKILSNESDVGRLKNIYGKADVLLVRHIVEHASDAVGFIKSLKNLLLPSGYMMLELPDSERILDANNHAFIWEEHISYFTATSVVQLAHAAGAQLVRLDRYRYPFEDSLIVILRFDDATPVNSQLTSGKATSAGTVLADFALGLETSREKWRTELKALLADGKKIAVFGGGHLATKFINFYGLTDLIDCVIDDHPLKQGMAMPGSALPICPSSELGTRGIRVCISTLSPESEVKVRVKLTDFFANGGVFIPAFSMGSD